MKIKISGQDSTPLKSYKEYKIEHDTNKQETIKNKAH